VHPQRATGLDARDAALAEPDQHHGVGAVEQFGLDSAGAALAVAFNAAQGADHRHFLSALTVDRLLGAGVGGFVGQLFYVELLRVLRQPAGEPTQIPFGRSHGLS